MNLRNLCRFSALKLNDKAILRNRVVVPPMASETADKLGFVTSETQMHYSRLTQSGASLLIVEYSFVHGSGRSEEYQLGISTDEHIPGLSSLSKIIHESGALAGIQFSHGGGKSERGLTGGVLMGPSAISVPVKDQILEIPSAMELSDIEIWKRSFLEAAGRAVRAGFDLIEFHSAHGYGLNQWLSPITNQRIDKYGIDLTGRLRLLLEVMKSVRENFPELLISVRIPGQDFLEGGLSIQDMTHVAQELEAHGVNIIHVSSGIGGWRRPISRKGEGYLVNEAIEIQKGVKIPVIGVGGIETGEYIDHGISNGFFTLAAVGRAILKDPRGWSEKNLCIQIPQNALLNP